MLSSTRTAPVPSRMNTDSVTSSSSRSAGRPLFASALVTTATKPGSWSWSGDTFTATRTSPGQRAASWHAVLSTQAPIGAISLASSASGTNLAGEIGPYSGCVQRSSASNPVSRAVSASTTGW